MSSTGKNEGPASSGTSTPSDRTPRTCPFCAGTSLYDGPMHSNPPTAAEIAAAEDTSTPKTASTGLRRCSACSGSGIRKGW